MTINTDDIGPVPPTAPAVLDAAAPVDVATPCAGKWELFDSTSPDDFHQAAILCRKCPFREWCDDERAKVESPRGTWAGTLYGGVSSNADYYERMECVYDDSEARDAHRSYLRGDRGAWAVEGKRVHERRQKRRQARARREAA